MGLIHYALMRLIEITFKYDVVATIIVNCN